MKIAKSIALLLFLFSFSASSSVYGSADVTITFRGNKAKVKFHASDSLQVQTDGAHVHVTSLYRGHRLRVVVSGRSDDGQLLLTSAGKAQVRLEGLDLTCQDGAPLWLKNKKRVEIVAARRTDNILCIAACQDTARQKAAVVWSKDKVRFSGQGSLRLLAKGDGCKGVRAKGDVEVERLNLQVITTGNNLGEDLSWMERMGAGFIPGDSLGFPPGGFGPPPFGEFGPPPFEDFDMPPFGEFGPPPGDSLNIPFGGFGGPMKHKYLGTAKALKSLGRIIVTSGTLDVQTNSPGAEGIEGKQGVELSGGTVTVLAVDDAINANAPILFSGADVTARSTTNDAVDANDYSRPFFSWGQGQDDSEPTPMIVVTDGTVRAWSQVGPPEEGLDCDFSPIAISGGTVFTAGSAMGDMPSVPTSATAQQPTLLLTGLPITEGQPVILTDDAERIVLQMVLPFSLQRSSSLLSHPSLKLGQRYTLRTVGYERTFSLTDSFTVVR